MKQTAVEWFYQRILAKDIKEVFEQAKEMEKKQIIDFAEDYEINESEKYPQKTFEQYYKETFNPETNEPA